jgi:biopolymer transport protein ExbB/TolQ
MVAFERALMLGLENFAASSSGRFWLQFCILIVLTVVAIVIIANVVFDRWKAMQHNRAQETAEDFNTALSAKDAVNDGLAERVAALESEVRSANARSDAITSRMDLMRDRHGAEMEGMRRAFEAEIADLRARLENFECVKAPMCAKRVRPAVMVEVKVGGTD